MRTRLPWVFDEITAPVEKQFGPSPMDGKAERAADPLHEDALALLLGDVEEGKVLGAKLTRDEVGEVADLRRDLAECADGEAGHAPRVVRVRLCLDRSDGACGRAELRVKGLDLPSGPQNSRFPTEAHGGHKPAQESSEGNSFAAL